MKDLGREAITSALGDAGCTVDEIEAVYFSNSLAGLITGQEAIRGQTVLHDMGIGTIPIINVENACASAGTALHMAWLSVASGLHETVLAVGVEKLLLEDKSKTFAAYRAGYDLDTLPDFGDGAGESRSPLVDRHAVIARQLMTERGVTRESLAVLAASALANGALNPLAHRRAGATVESILNARLVVDPLTVPMISPISDGAAAAVVCAANWQRKDRDIRILASTLRSLPGSGAGPVSHSAAADAAYEMAALGPDDIDVAEVHDASSPLLMTVWCHLGLCPPGEEEQWAQTGRTALDGPLPINPSGGMIARGHPIGSTGLAQVHELAMQLRGEAGARQVEHARIAMAHVGGGVIGTMTAASAVHLLSV